MKNLITVTDELIVVIPYCVENDLFANVLVTMNLKEIWRPDHAIVTRSE